MITLVNKSRRVVDSDVQKMARACAYQLRYHVAPAWSRLNMPVVFAKDESVAPPGSWVLGVFDDADQAGDLGWHTEENGIFYGRVFAGPVLDNGGDALSRQLSVASVASHEVLEIFGDPTCNYYAEGPDGSWEIAVELCDPVESDSYSVKIDNHSITVSNFVLPRWFDTQAQGGKFDYMGLCSQPFEMSSGGYVVIKKGGKVTQEFGRRYPDWRKEMKKSALSRTSRRMAGGSSSFMDGLLG